VCYKHGIRRGGGAILAFFEWFYFAAAPVPTIVGTGQQFGEAHYDNYKAVTA
jgi:hypothetical protein